MNDKLRWRLAKLVVLSWARKGRNLNSNELEHLSSDIDRAYRRACTDSTLIDEFASLVDTWGSCVEQGIKWLNGNDDVVSGLDDKDRAIIAEVRLQDHKKFLDDCYKKEK